MLKKKYIYKIIKSLVSEIINNGEKKAIVLLHHEK